MHLIFITSFAVAGFELKKRWKNLKDSFSREVLHEQRCRAGQTKKKKRKYFYYDNLSFLAPVISHRAIEVGVFDFVSVPSNDSDIIETFDSEDGEDFSIEEEDKDEDLKRKIPEFSVANESDALATTDDKNERVYDEDISFAEMLVPILKRLTDDQKFYAKTQILNVLQHAKEL